VLGVSVDQPPLGALSVALQVPPPIIDVDVPDVDCSTTPSLFLHSKVNDVLAGPAPKMSRC
jgi:hypothetical protein